MIAPQLSISPATFKRHLENIFAKLGVRDRTATVAFALRAEPLVGRIVAVADVFDALTHDRPYKPAWPVERAIARIERGAGTQFDPRVVAAFMEMPHRLTEVVVPDALPRHLAPSETPQRRWGAVAQAEPPTLARPA